jgi:hypothetical protein
VWAESRGTSDSRNLALPLRERQVCARGRHTSFAVISWACTDLLCHLICPASRTRDLQLNFTYEPCRGDEIIGAAPCWKAFFVLNEGR